MNKPKASSSRIQAKPAVDQRSDTSAADALIESVRRGRAEEARRALAAGVPVDALGCFGMSALAMAARMGRMEIAKALLAAGADPNLNGGMAASAALWARKGKSLEMLVRAGLDLNAGSLLHWAAREGFSDMVDKLLELGADPLRPWIVRDLAAQAASRIARVEEGRDPVRCVKAMLAKASPPNFGAGAEYVANAIRRQDCPGPTELAFLESVGVDLDAPLEDEGGWRPLALAASSGSVEVVKELMDLARGRGRVPKQWPKAVEAARRAGKPAVAELIQADMSTLREALAIGRAVGKAPKPAASGKGLRI